MAISYDLAPIPKWTFNDKQGNPLSGGKVYVYRNLAKTERAYVYQTNDDSLPYNQPIVLDTAGSAGPFYWKFDTNNTDELYYLEVYDSNDVQQFSVDDYPIVSGGGGGGSVTTTVSDITNHIVNNVFENNIGDGDTAIDVSNITNIILCPSTHQGFTAPTSNQLGGDIRFVKNITGATDNVSFPYFAGSATSIGNTSLDPDLTPNRYFQLICSATAAESYKCLQIPINKDIQNFAGEQVTITFWGKSTGLNTDVELEWLPFFGDGPSASSIDKLVFDTHSLDATWTQYTTTATVPTYATKTIGECGNDALYLNIKFPVNLAFTTMIAKPALYLGDKYPEREYQDNDEIAAVVNSPRTGDIRMSMNSFGLCGWVAMNDGSIGSSGSSATTRANTDTFPLYQMIWDSIPEAYAPVYDSSGAADTRGSTAADDFKDNKRLQLTRVLGRVLAGGWGASSVAGVATTTVQENIVSVDTGTEQLELADASSFFTGAPVVFKVGADLPAPLVLGTVYYAIYVDATHIKLATTAANAIAGTAINLTDAGTGTQTLQVPAYQLGEYAGDYIHTLTTSEIPNITNNDVKQGSSGNAGSTSSVLAPSGNAFPLTINSGGGNAHNNMQNTAFMNIFAKL